jgi:hypothetical protein
MTQLPISRLVIYKHGVGYFERRGPFSGEQLELSFPRVAMDDVLKSLIALDLGAGQVLSVDLATPEDRASRIAKGSIHLSDQQSLLDLLRDLRGRQVRLLADEGKKAALSLEGTLIGVDYEPTEPLRRARVAIFLPESQQVRSLALEDLDRVDLLDPAAASDLSYFLRAAQSDEERRSAVLRLSPGDHEMLVGYVAPAPAWRVSYRLLFEAPTTPDAAPVCLLQGWGLFDNELDEDLSNVELTLMAGMPVSFRYRLYEPHTPERPLIADETRTVNAPIEFAMLAFEESDSFGAGAPMPMMAAAAPPPSMGRMAPKRVSAADMEAQAAAEVRGAAQGALFAYTISHPVSVARGQSAMVPIVQTRLGARRELLYKSQRSPGSNQLPHPVAALRLTNTTGLTLERGPVTVLVDGVYAGEAVAPFTSPNAEMIVAYAVELGITVHEQRTHERRLHGVKIADALLVIEEYTLWHSQYELTSSLDQEVTVLIEHPTQPQHSLFETPEPNETGSGVARWQVVCPPRTQVKRQISEAQLVQRHEQVRTLKGSQIADYLARGLLDPATAKGLEGVLNLYRQIDEARKQISQIEQQREKIYAQQRQIQGNLQPLGRDGDEGVLRQRYVATLATLEDQLAAQAEAISDLHKAISRLDEQATRRIKRLGTA